jgi:membrane associated rhomboid family serine protease
MFSFLNNIPQVTKNILILNVMFFGMTFFFEKQGTDLIQILGAHYVNSPLFQPYQIVTHFFMHGGLLHIFFNMWLLVMLGSFLERLWGPKRFFIFYIVSAFGAFTLFNALGVTEIIKLRSQLSDLGYNMDQIDSLLKSGRVVIDNSNLLEKYYSKAGMPMVGASGAIFGILAAFAILFPNTEFLIYFTLPVKAKYLVGGYFLLELYLSFQNNAGDPVAHLAHVGGAIAGAIMVLIWRKTDKKHFW